MVVGRGRGMGRYYLMCVGEGWDVGQVLPFSFLACLDKV